MTRKFKIGDRVKVLNCGRFFMRVIGIDKHDVVKVYWQNLDNNRSGESFYLSEALRLDTYIPLCPDYLK